MSFFRTLTLMTCSVALGWPAISSADPSTTVGPSLTESTDAVCNTVLDEYRKIYTSNGDHSVISTLSVDEGNVQTSDRFNNDKIKWLQWSKVEGFPGRGALLKATIKLHGTDQTLYAHARSHSWRGDIFTIYLPDASDIAKLSETLSTQEDDNKLRRIYPIAPTGYSWYWNNVFEFDGANYLIDESGEFISNNGLREVFRIGDNGEVASVCKLALYKTLTSAEINHQYTGYRTFIDGMDKIGGAGYVNCGTLNAHGRAKGEGAAIANTALYRPWALNSNPLLSGKSPDLSPLLENWSLGSIWDHREYSSFVSIRAAAKHDLARWYVSALGYDTTKADTQADTSLAAIQRGYLNHWNTLPIAPEDSAFRRQIIKGENFDWTRAELKDRDMSNNDEPYTLDSMMSLALDNEASLDAIIKRWPLKDIKNHYGKDLLMYAAHMNHYAAVEKLLSLGADVNSTTVNHSEGFDCVGTPSIEKRTPLMYAAENASLEVILLLVNDGAQLDAKDSKGQGIDSYFAKNPRFSSADKQAGIRTVIEKSKASAMAISPSFSCEKPGNAIEKTICTDKTSALYDRELMSAYTQLVNGSPDPQFEKNDQRDWLKLRKTACLTSPEAQQLTACVRQWTRGRLHYLFKRIES